ncbi:MAG: DUF4198 domain-containing protein [Bacillota bacterium]
MADSLVWLEPESLHYHTGDVAHIKALQGKMMRREAGADFSGWVGYAVDPAGDVLDADIVPGGADYHRVAFFTGGEGLYSLVLENGFPDNAGQSGEAGSGSGSAGGNRPVQRARLSVPVGHDIQASSGNLCKEGLDVYCEEFKQYSPGDIITIRVMYNGRPLSGASLAATHHLHEGDGYLWQGETGSEGAVSLKLTDKGHWLFVCRHTGAGIVHTSTFVVPGVR